MTGLCPDEAERFIRDNTTLEHPPHLPELRLHLAGEAHALWLKTEEELAALGLPPPFWAFAWAGGQGLARYVLDHPETVKEKRVFDLASGSGLVALAAAMAGAAKVTANDIDPFTDAAVRLNARANAVSVDFDGEDRLGQPLSADVLLAGDVFYDREWAARLVPWFEDLRRQGIEILLGDPGRAYLPKSRLAPLATYEVPTTRALEDAEVKRTTVWRFGCGGLMLRQPSLTLARCRRQHMASRLKPGNDKGLSVNGKSWTSEIGVTPSHSSFPGSTREFMP